MSRSQILLSLRKVPPAFGLGAAAVMSAITGLLFFNASNLGGTNTQQSLIAQTPQLCRIVSPVGGKLLAKLRPEPQTEVGALKQISLGERVLFIRSKGDFVKVKLSDGTQGWVFGDEIQPCDTSKASSKESS
jgi:serine/threonine-protein kinase